MEMDGLDHFTYEERQTGMSGTITIANWETITLSEGETLSATNNPNFRFDVIGSGTLDIGDANGSVITIGSATAPAPDVTVHEKHDFNQIALNDYGGTFTVNHSANGTTFNIFDGGTLELRCATGQSDRTTIALSGTGNTIILDHTSQQFNAAITGFNDTDAIDLGDVSGAATAVYNDGTISIDDQSGKSLFTLTDVKFAPGVSTTDLVVTPLDGNSFGIEVACFVRGTRIATPSGPRAVETLVEGDLVVTLGDRDHPVRWLGRTLIDLAAHPRPETVAPVRIARGAFADDLPHNDLLLSPDHAIFVDGMLICARQLINGTTLQQEKHWTSVEYFHVELDEHAILLAEGLPAESYLDTGNRDFFADSGQSLTPHLDLAHGAGRPRREVGSCAPFVWDEAAVRPVWQRLAEQAAAHSQPVPKCDTTTDPELGIRIGGQLVRPVFKGNGLLIFALPGGATEVHLVSRAASPTDARPWMEDRRRLGVYVKRIMIRGANEVHDIPVDHPDFLEGWWDVEQSGATMLRWTDGDAVLPLPAMDDPLTMLELHIGGSMTYLTGGSEMRRGAGHREVQ